MKKKIAICGSMVFFDRMVELRKDLCDLNNDAFLPEEEEPSVSLYDLEASEVAQLKNRYIKAHLEKIKISDGILIANYSKKGITGYVGANTLMEMAFALGETNFCPQGTWFSAV